MVELFDYYCNNYVVSNGKEAILIDAGLPESTISYIRKVYDLKAVLLTHGHYDHIEGLKYLKDLDIYIHEDEEAFLYDSNLNLYVFSNGKSYTKGELKIHTVKDNDILELIGYQIKVIHTPGHTRGSVCYKIDNNLFSGDTLFKLSVGRTDFPTGDMSSLMNSLEKLRNLNEELKVYPGHMDETTLFYEIYNNNYFGD